MARVRSAFLARLALLFEHRAGPFSAKLGSAAVSVGLSDIACDMGCAGELVVWENHDVFVEDGVEEVMLGRYNLTGM